METSDPSWVGFAEGQSSRAGRAISVLCIFLRKVITEGPSTIRIFPFCEKFIAKL